jgi:hypothetical protein
VATTLKKRLENVAGRLCEVLIPIKHEYYIGEGNSVAVCTLSSMDLLQTIARTADVMNRILIVGILLSENKGILYPIIMSVSVLIQVKSFPSLPHR